MKANAAGFELNLQMIGAPEILDALADGAYITNTDRRIVFWSRAAERITGWSAAEVVGHKCSDNILMHLDKDGRPLCGEDECPLHRAIITGAMSQEPVLVFAQHKEGRRVPVEVSVAPLRNRHGETVGGIEIFRDWTNVLDDLHRAKAIQDHSLQSQLPADPRLEVQVRYTPEDLVGGDFYRLEPLGADRYGVMIADVMGHGMAAALYTMQLRSLWEECRSFLGQPAPFADAMNQRLFRLTQADGYFATGVLLTIDLAAQELVYANAGHPAPAIFRADGRVEDLGVKSPALGLMENTVYRQATLPFRPGDCLLLFTDGATEIEVGGDEDLGREGLLRLVKEAPSGWDLGWLEKRLLEQSREIRLPDDLTLIRLRLPSEGPTAV